MRGFSEMYEQSEKIYNTDYNKGEYCHEQSFKWGFQEGTEFAKKLFMEREKTPELGERIIRLMKWVHYEKNSPYRSLEEKATLREVATLLIQAFPEFKQSNKDIIGL